MNGSTRMPTTTQLLARARDWRSRRRIRLERDRRLVPPPPWAFASFGRSVIVPPTRVGNPHRIEVGEGVVVLEHSWFSVVEHFPDITPRVSIGDRVRIGRCCQLSVIGELVIDDDAIVGDFVQIGDTFHPYEATDRMAALTRPIPVRIGRGAVIGSHAVLLPGSEIGDGALVDHHAVVNGRVQAGTVVGGYPARVRKEPTV